MWHRGLVAVEAHDRHAGLQAGLRRSEHADPAASLARRLPPTFAASFAARLARSVASRRALIAVVLGFAGVVPLASAPRSAGDLAGREQQLQQGIGTDNGRIQSYQGKLSDLRTRMEALETSLHVQQALLSKIQSQLSAARADSPCSRPISFGAAASWRRSWWRSMSRQRRTSSA